MNKSNGKKNCKKNKCGDMFFWSLLQRLMKGEFFFFLLDLKFGVHISVSLLNLVHVLLTSMFSSEKPVFRE